MASRLAKAVATHTGSSKTTTTTNATKTKHLWILRHGQATHNPRAEAARDNGCSHEEFMELMRQDDSLDSQLTPLGQEQAKTVYEKHCKTLQNDIELLVSSPLSRAIQTADLSVPLVPKRVVVEEFREINGWLLNAQRRTRTALEQSFQSWNFEHIHEDEDTLWTPELESQEACRERGYQGLCWILQQPEEKIFLVCHGGILRFTMTQHELVKLEDGRDSGGLDRPPKPVEARFENCELRRYEIAWEEQASVDTSGIDGSIRRILVLKEVDHEE